MKDNLPTYDFLEKEYQNKRATLPIDHINHREFVKDGIRYFCGYSSQRAETFKDGSYKVQGWMVYKSENN